MQDPIAEEKACRSSFKVCYTAFRQACEILGEHSLLRWDKDSLDAIINTMFVGKIHINEARMNEKMYRDILDKNLLPSTRMIKMKLVWTFQRDNDPKHSQGNSQLVSEKESQAARMT